MFLLSKAIFPYDHDFYDAVNNQFVSHFKWLKAVHNYKKKPFTADSPLPSDMVIQVCYFIEFYLNYLLTKQDVFYLITD